MGTNIRRDRIRRAFNEHEESESPQASFERGIGKLPRKRRDPENKQVTDGNSERHKKSEIGDNVRPIHPIESRLSHNGNKILNILKRHDGYMPVGDHSPPQEIFREFGMSKRMFKQAIGHLWKQRKIEILHRKGIRITMDDPKSKTR
jgi:hypothetical protein